MNEDPLESSLRAHYREFPDDAGLPALTARVDRTLGPGARGGFRWLRPASYLAGGAAVIAVVALVAAPLWYPALRVGPAATGTASPSAPSRTVAPTERAFATPRPTPASAPAIYGADVLTRAEAWTVGTIRNGGFWAIQKTATAANLLLSVDGQSWTGHPIELPAVTAFGGDTPLWVFVLDREHAWSIVPGPGSKNPMAGQGAPFDSLQLIVNRTSDGGRTWQASAPVPGDYPDRSLTMSFVDPHHGFLIASPIAPGGPSSVLRTADGGATWTVVAAAATLTNGNLGSNFTASDASTLWAGAQGDARGDIHELLAVSRDGGRTWSNVHLVPEDRGGSNAGAVPEFFSASDGVVRIEDTNGTSYFRTTDAGATWSRVTPPSDGTGRLDFLDAQNAYAVHGGSPPALLASSDGGRTWTERPMSGLPADQAIADVTFTDREHGLTTGGYTGVGSVVLVFTTADGGATWRPADLGVPAGQPVDALDAAIVRGLVEQYETFNAKGAYGSSFALLGPSDQQRYGPKAKWETSWTSDPQRAQWQPSEIGTPQRLTRADLGDERWNEIAGQADVSRLYGVGVNHRNMPGLSASSEVLAVAPLLDGSGWRIWWIH